jgi:hypothetical protein
MTRKEVKMGVLKILVPYNFTTYDEKALNFIIATFLQPADVRITLFHTYTALPELDHQASPEIVKMRDGMVFLTKEIMEKEAGLKAVKSHLVGQGFKTENIECIFKKKARAVAEEILDVIQSGRHAILILSHHTGRVPRFFARSVHNRILTALRDVTLCIVT